MPPNWWWHTNGTVLLMPGVVPPILCKGSKTHTRIRWTGVEMCKLQIMYYSFMICTMYFLCRYIHVCIPIVIAVAIWGQKWTRRRVLCYCDNTAVVAVMWSRYSKEPGLMHMLQCIFFMEAHFACMQSATHVPGAMNTRADELSCNRLSSFLSKVKSASRCPSHIPQQLIELLTETEQDWNYPHRTQQFVACVRKA